MPEVVLEVQFHQYRSLPPGRGSTKTAENVLYKTATAIGAIGVAASTGLLEGLAMIVAGAA